MNTTEQKVDETISELKQWLEKPDARDFYYNQAITKIEEKYKESKIPKSILISFSNLLDAWYSNNFVYELLTKEITALKADAASNGYNILLMAEAFAQQYPGNPPKLPFEKIAFWLANCISEKWYKEGEILIKIIDKGLETKFLDGGFEIKLTAWFIIEMVNKGYNISIDYSKYNYPENMGVYQEALDNWNTSDLNLVDSIVTKLCDYHLQQAAYGDGENTMHIQFNNDVEFVYAYEILTWLSIREKIGLKNPETFTHSLMGLELNKLPAQIISMPKNELFEKIFLKLKS
jgi:hypothetical protein